MKLSPRQRRAQRRARTQSSLDLNLVALIDIFTILIFFLMANAGVQLLSAPKAVALPASMAQQSPKQTHVITVTAEDIFVDGRKVANSAAYINSADQTIAPLKAALEQLLAERPGANQRVAPAQAITVVGDKNIPYQLLHKVMSSSAAAGVQQISFAVQRKAQSAVQSAPKGPA